MHACVYLYVYSYTYICIYTYTYIAQCIHVQDKWMTSFLFVLEYNSQIAVYTLSLNKTESLLHANTISYKDCITI